MDSKQFHLRLHGVIVAMAALLVLFLSVLYQLQVVEGAEYRARSTRSITNKETVEAVRGEILDSNGRVLVSNRATYQVKLDVAALGDSQARNTTLTKLLELCRKEGVTWTDTMPISKTQPYQYTLDDATGSVRSAFASLMSTMKWSSEAAQALERVEAIKTYNAALEASQEAQDAGKVADTPKKPSGALSAQPLMDKMREYYGIDPALTESQARDLIGILYELSLRTQNATNSAYIFAKDVDIRFITGVKEGGLAGVRIEATTVREYDTTYAAHLLGRVGPIYAEEWQDYKSKGYAMDDTVGKDGVEKAFEEYLRGVAGTKTIESNSNGKVVSEAWDVDIKTGETLAPQPGNNVVTTLDLRLQEALERSLADRVPGLTEQVKGAAGVVVDMKGGIKAMASYPTFDLANIYTDNELYNQAMKDPLTPLFNRATQGLYSPGSTFKMITGVAALQEGKATAREKILDTGRFQYPKGEKYPYGDYHPACWKFRQYGGTHGWENMGEALKDSCNIFFYTLGDRLGIDLINEYAGMFGLGQKTGIELKEEVGMVASPETSEKLGQTWYGGNLLSASIGQGNTLCTPLQLANYIATLVNGGDHYPAHLLKTVKTNDYSQVVLENDPKPLDTINISPENLDAVKKGMYLLANEGSVKNYFKDLPVTVGAKTGTAQVGSESAEANAVFVCFAPYDDPQIAIALVAERGGSGGELAAIAADVLSAYFSRENTVEAVPVEGTLIR